MTTNYALHRAEQMEAARDEFVLVWAMVIALDPKLNTPSHQVRGWVEFLRHKNILKTTNTIPPTT